MESAIFFFLLTVCFLSCYEYSSFICFWLGKGASTYYLLEFEFD